MSIILKVLKRLNIKGIYTEKEFEEKIW